MERTGTFLLGIAAAALITFFFPFGSQTDWHAVVKARAGEGAVAVTGNSVLDHSSRCDPVSETIPQLIGDELKQPVIDLSASGQLLDESLSYAGIALRNKRITRIILPVSFFSFGDQWAPPIQRALFLDWISAGPREFPISIAHLTGRKLQAHEAFDYAGRQYPDYEGIKARYFQRERSLMGCPEDNGNDKQFIEAYCYHMYLASPVGGNGVSAIIAMAAEARKRGKTFQVVLLPIDYQDIGGFNPEFAARLRGEVAGVVGMLREGGVSILDISDAVPSAAFADHWCACGHLQLEGRKIAANLIADFAGQQGTSSNPGSSAH